MVRLSKVIRVPRTTAGGAEVFRVPRRLVDNSHLLPFKKYFKMGPTV